MACKVGGGARILLPGLSILENQAFERSCGITLATCAFQHWSCEPSSSGRTSKIGLKPAPCLQNRYILSSVSISTSPKKAMCCPCTVFRHLPLRFLRRRHDWRIAFALDTGGIPGNDEQESINGGDNNGLGGTRLGRIVSAGGRQLLEKLNSARKSFPMKIFLLLLGFYTANALATILGQTGDWDVLVAGVVVAAIEGIGMLMYRKPPSVSTGRLQSFVVMVNYWKAGVCLGLFVDAFKLGS